MRLKTSRDSGTNGVARLLIQHPERIASAWRKARLLHPTAKVASHSCLDGVIAAFLRELGLCLEGKPGSPWDHTQGVLRFSAVYGSRLLYDDFAALRHCLDDALEVLEAEAGVRTLLHAALDEAVDSAVALWQQQSAPASPSPRSRPTGPVITVFEKRPAPIPPPPRSPAGLVH